MRERLPILSLTVSLATLYAVSFCVDTRPCVKWAFFVALLSTLSVALSTKHGVWGPWKQCLVSLLSLCASVLTCVYVFVVGMRGLPALLLHGIRVQMSAVMLLVMFCQRWINLSRSKLRQ